ncbi:MAG: NAD-dependent epimerase/dehydratase family protein [Planctomycetota bacterium]
MRVLVTGATGFLGQHVVTELLRRGDSVRALVRPGRARPWLDSLPIEQAPGDLLEAASLKRACDGVEALVHAAAHKGLWSRRDAEQRAVNVEGTAALLRAATAARLTRIVHVSTVAAVALRRDRSVADESAHWNGASSGIAYARSKREGEDRAFAAARGKVPVVVVNPGLLLGPRCDGGPPSSLVRGLLAGRVRWAPAGGTSATDVEDVARAIVAALTRGRTNERYILAGHNLTWRELYAVITRAAGRPGPRGDLPAGLRHLLVPAASLLGWARLDRPPWAAERFRLWGLYGWFDSSRAQAELGYQIRPLDEIAARIISPMPPAHGTGHVFHPGHDEWHGQTVVVRTTGARTVIGRWDAVAGGQVQMRDAAVHDSSAAGDAASEGREAWIARLKQYGIPVQHLSYALPAAEVASVVRLRDA